MTKEELKQEAEESFEQYKVTDEDYVVSPYSDDLGEKMLMYNYEYYAEETYLRIYTKGFLAGAEPRENEIKSLGERCLQLQKDKGELIDKVRDLEEKLANADYQLEGRDLEIKELKSLIKKIKQDLDSARENANRQEQWEIYSVLNNIYNDNFEVITGVSN